MTGRNLAVLATVVFFGAATPTHAFEVLGVGTESLLGDDLTDIDNDGDQLLYAAPDELGFFDAEFFSSDEPGFEGGEFAFNVFDNILGPGNDKWCCGTSFPQIVGADFRNTHDASFLLTHFTVSSANDVPERDPRVWTIEGSNDGECWETIFIQSDPAASLWTERLQVIEFREGEDYDEQERAYSMFRMVTLATGLAGGAFFQIGEIEFFGEEDDPPADCIGAQCTDSVENVTCAFGPVGDGEGITVSWDETCECEDPTLLLIDGAEVASVEPGTTTAEIPATEFPDGVFSVEVRNCSGFGTTCSGFKTTSTGYIVGNSWLALGPFATPVACDGDETQLLTNHIGPDETLQCQFPADGDPVEGYEPGDPLFPDPDLASTFGYHPDAPTDDDGNPIWRPYQDATPTDADLDFDSDIAGNLNEHVLFIATWVENTSDEPIEISACFGSDDDPQAWLDDQLIWSTPACRGRGDCNDQVFFTLPPGVHVIKLGAWEQGGGWGVRFSLRDAATLEPIVDLADGLVALPIGASPFSEDIIFHGRTRPEGFEEPECGDGCSTVTDLTCERDDDGSVELVWTNPDGCDSEIRILAGNEELAVLPAGSDTFAIDGGDLESVSTLSVDNGSLAPASCSLIEFSDLLLGNDLTDLDDDGDPILYAPPDDFGLFDAEFFSSDEPGFEGGEFAFNVFDNVVGGGNEKWCCGTVFPQIVGADFSEFDGPFRLTHFTVASANDTPARDPRVWRIEGSNDGEEWTTIYSQDDPTSAVWTARNQVAVFRGGRDFPEQTEAFMMFRMITEATGLTAGAFFQISEIELFGDEGGGPVGALLLPGDVNLDRGFNIADMIALLNFLFGDGTLDACLAAPDVEPAEYTAAGFAVIDFNGDGGVNIADAIGGLNRLFGDGGPHVLGLECIRRPGTCVNACP